MKKINTLASDCTTYSKEFYENTELSLAERINLKYQGVSSIEIALLQIEYLKKQRKLMRKQIQNRKEMVSKILTKLKETVQQPL